MSFTSAGKDPQHRALCGPLDQSMTGKARAKAERKSGEGGDGPELDDGATDAAAGSDGAGDGGD